MAEARNATATKAGRVGSTALYRKLKPGPGLSPEAVAENQLGRIRGAVIELVAADGYRALTIGGLARAAGISKPTFYKFFDGKESCFRATYDTVVRCAARAVLASQMAPGSPDERLRSGLEALLGKLDEAPNAARFSLVAIYEFGPDAERLERHAQNLFATMLCDAPGTEHHGPATSSPFIARAVVAGVNEAARERILSGRAASPEPLAEWGRTLCAVGPEKLGALRTQRPVRPEVEELMRKHERPEQVGDDIALLLTSCARTADKHGYRNLTVEHICATAGISRRAFRAEFSDAQDCFLTATRKRFAQLRDVVAEARSSTADWAEGARRAVDLLCATAARDSAVRPLFRDLAAAGPEGVALRTAAIAELAEVLSSGRPADDRLARASTTAIWSSIHDHLAAGRTAALDRLSGPLTYLFLAPSIGPEAALRRSVPLVKNRLR